MSMSLEDQIDRLILYLSLATPKRKGMPAPSDFDEAEPLGEDFGRAACGAGADRFYRDAAPPESLDVSVINPNPRGHGFVIGRMRRVSPAACRGKIQGFHGYVIKCTAGLITDEGVLAEATDQYVAASVGGGALRFRYVTAMPGGARPAPGYASEADEIAYQARVACSVADARRRLWRVVLGYVGHPSLSFATGPEGAREVFRLRDIPEGKARRAALRHWVRSHWRKREGEDSTRVRAHLRGASAFIWNDLACSIVPSPLEVEHGGPHDEKTPPR